MHDIIILVQSEIVSALNGDAAISAAIEGVYDQVPEQSVLPYISIENVSAEQLETVGRASYRSVATLRYHETYGSKQPSLDFIGLIVSVLELIKPQNSLFNITIGTVQISAQLIDKKHNTRSTELSLELYIDRLGA